MNRAFSFFSGFFLPQISRSTPPLGVCHVARKPVRNAVELFDFCRSFSHCILHPCISRRRDARFRRSTRHTMRVNYSFNIVNDINEGRSRNGTRRTRRTPVKVFPIDTHTTTIIEAIKSRFRRDYLFFETNYCGRML